MGLENLHEQERVLAECAKDVYLWGWLVVTFILAGMMSTLKWLNSPMPNKTWGRGILSFLNGFAVSFLMALFLGDKVLSQEITVLQFTFCVILTAFGGSQLLDLITDFVLGLCNKAVHDIFPENHTEK